MASRLDRPLPAPPAALRRGPLRAGAFPSRLHDALTAVRIGRWLGAAFAVCFVTGLISHYLQQPPSWLTVPSRPVWGYRLTQGIHVATGIACVPLLLAKLWTVYPRLWSWPPVRSVRHGLERLSVLLLVASAVFELATGLVNIAQWYPWAFYFPRIHYYVGYIAIGSIGLHVAVKLPTIATALAGQRAARRGAADQAAPGPPTGAPPAGTGKPAAGPPAGGRLEAAGPAAGADRAHAAAAAPAAAPASADGRAAGPAAAGVDGRVDEPVDPGLTRRGLMVAVGAGVAAVTVTTVGQTFPPLRRLTLLAPRRPDIGPQGLPINRTAQGAGVTDLARHPGYRLVVAGPHPFSLTLAELQGMPQYQAVLPIACVEGWSVTASWRGVRVRDLLDRAGAPAGAQARAVSLERNGLYASSVIGTAHARDELTLLALQVNGQPLALDHGYPLRLIAPDRPGVLQTKWVHRLEVLS